MWLLTGLGFPPDMDERDMESYIDHLESELKTVKERLKLYREVKRQLVEKMRADGVIDANDDVVHEYKIDKRRKDK